MTLCSQLWLLTWKNWLLQKRKVLVTVFQLLLPLFFAGILLAIRSASIPQPFNNATLFNATPLTETSAMIFVDFWEELGYTPDTALTKRIVARVQNKMDLYVKGSGLLRRNSVFIHMGFSTEQEIVDYFKIHPDNLTMAIVFKGLDGATVLPTNVKYYIRPKTFDNKQWMTANHFPFITTEIPRLLRGTSEYFVRGILVFQTLIAESLIEEWGHVISLNVSMNRMPYPPYVIDSIITIIQSELPLFIILSFLLSVIQTTKTIVEEKEQRLKESMKLMGLLPSAHWASWFLMCFIYLAIATGIYAFFLCFNLSSAGPVLIHASSSLFYLFLLIYATSIITFCFMISVFVQSANVGAAVSGVLYFVFYLPYVYLSDQYETLTFSQKMSACLLFNQAMAFGAKVIGLYEGTSEGIQWDNLFTPVSLNDNFSLGDSIIMMIVDSLIHIIITWYLDNVFPGEFGVPRPYYFCFMRSYWSRPKTKKSVSSFTIAGDPRYFERDPADLTAGIRICNLYKEFRSDKVAVDHVSLNMYEGQITVLLGHNGAGKTTTMSMLTGFIPATSGTAYIYDQDINRDIASIRKSLGLCPQHDILFKTLTVEEHLIFFAKLKGCPGGKVKQEVDSMIKEVGLEEKRTAQSHTLSGGQKRKLGVAIALIHGSKVVILDEPSSGMDPAARRQTWEVLQNNRAGRTILLTTHFMDEADVLGDRIAIMAEGVVKCCGTSLFLKKLYGAGYHLVIVKNTNCNTSAVANLVTSTIPGAEFETETNTEVTYILPDDQSALFAGLFRSLENQKEELGIINFGVSATTMEEVFLKVGESRHELEGIINDAFEQVNENQSMSTSAVVDSQSARDVDETDSKHSDHADSPKTQPQTVVVMPDSAILAFARGYSKLTGVQLQLSQLQGVIIKKAIIFWRNWMISIVQLLLPVFFTCMALYSDDSASALKTNEPALDFDLDYFGKTIIVYSSGHSPSTTTNELANTYASQFSQAHTTVLESLSEQNMNEVLAARVKAMGISTYNNRLIVGAQFEARGQDIATTAWYNGQPYHSEPIALAYALNALAKHYVNSSINIRAGLIPFPRNEKVDAEDNAMAALLTGFGVGLSMCIGMAFLVSSFAYFPISERTVGAKHLQVVSGVNHVLFWLGSFLWDYLTFMMTLVLLLIVFAIYDTEAYVNEGRLGIVFLLLFLYALASLPFVYFVHFFFTSAASGMVVLIVYNIFSGMISMLVVLILSRLQDVDDLLEIFNMLFPLLFPNYCLGASFKDMYQNYIYNEFCTGTINYKAACLNRSTPCCRGYDSYMRWEEPGIGRYLLFLVVQGLLFSVLTFVVEYKIHEILLTYIFACIRSKIKPLEDHLEDDDVVAERKRINATPVDVLIKQDSLLLVNLYKRYGSFVAVNQSCVGIPENECFGLLGTNGAGKTTTFKMLTGDVIVTSGNAYLNGFDIKHNIKKVQAIMGYCPQFDALIDQMTGRETLVMYARLRGVPAPNIPNCVNCLSDVLTLRPHMDKLCKAYSGGNKRKLSVGIALIGNPAFVFLDEPSSGMDPAARRQMWTVLSQVRQTGKTLILTSHSMEECEALCTRIAIMVKGRFVCLGSTQHLKSKFGQGYTLEAKMMTLEDGSTGPTDSVVLYIKQCFPSAKLFDEHEGYVHLQIPDPSVHLADVFDAMERAKRDLKVQDYNVHQTSLEQVFLAFTRLLTDETK